MAEINNQRVRMLAWSEGTDNGRQKPEIMVMTSLWRRAIYWLLRSPSQTCHAKPKTQNHCGAGRYQLLSRWWDAYRKQLAWKTSLRKVRTLWHCSDGERGGLTYDWSWWISVRQIDRCSNIWASLPGAGYGQFEHKADSLIAKFKEAGGTVREIDGEQSSPRLSPLWLSASSSALSWAVNVIVDNAITHKAQRDKNARELKLANAAITDMQMRQRDVAALDAKYRSDSWC